MKNTAQTESTATFFPGETENVDELQHRQYVRPTHWDKNI
jgi:hypothetical protein